MEKSHPKISVIIPAYNRKAIIARALQSILNQTYTDYEAIVVDDGSSDGTSELIKEEFPWVNLIVLDQNCGVAKARNIGIKNALGDYIAFLDSDDEWKSEYLAKQIELMEASPESVLSCTGCYISKSYQNNRINNESWQVRISPDINLVVKQLFGVLIPALSIVMVRKEALIQVGLFNEKLCNCEDRELYMRLLANNSMSYSSEFLVNKYENHLYGNLTHNYYKWARDAYVCIDLFLNSIYGEPYRHLRYASKASWAKRFAKLALKSYNLTFFLQQLSKYMFYKILSLNSRANLKRS